MSLWDSLQKMWRGWARSEFYGPSPTEDEVVEKIAEDFATVIEAQGKPFVRQVVIEANKAGLPKSSWQYLFHAIAGDPAGWPQMPDVLRNALLFGRQVMSRAGVTPNYRDGLDVPLENLEGQIDQAIKGVAFWVAKEMVGTLHKAYLKLLQKWRRAMRAATKDTRLPDDKVLPWAKQLFEAQVERNPMQFRLGNLLDQFFFRLLR